ncbi:hypothetical protein Y032_0005g2329 [Ancylostoma ceylanicum]|nr:hypothetical protein Y032_0005g2329 [Ancylostoma ceylanicum]
MRGGSEARHRTRRFAGARVGQKPGGGTRRAANALQWSSGWQLRGDQRKKLVACVACATFVRFQDLVTSSAHRSSPNRTVSTLF